MFKFVQKIFQKFVLIELVFLGSIFAMLGVVAYKINWTKLNGLDWAMLVVMLIYAAIPMQASLMAKQKAKQDNSEQV